MPEFSFEVEQVQDIANTVLLVVSGAIDAKTVPSFQENISRLREAGATRYVMDMEGIKYINSTGFSYLVNLAEALETVGGGIVLVRVHPKVKVVIDMLGLNDFFKIFPSRKEALAFFKAQAQVEKPALAAAKAGDSSTSTVLTIPADVAAVAPVPATSGSPATAGTYSPAAAPSVAVARPPASAPAIRPEPVSPSAVAPPTTTPPVAAAPSAALAVPVSQISAALPTTCATCKAPLTTQGAGSYACPRCFALFSVGADGTVSFMPRAKFPPVNLTLSPTPECVDGLYAFVGILAQKAGFSKDRVMAIQGAVKETANTIAELACEGNINSVYQVSIGIMDSAISITFAVFGKRIDAAATTETGREYFAITRRTMDTFEVTHGPYGGNIITLVKELK